MNVSRSSDTLGSLLRVRALAEPDRLAYRFLPDGDGAPAEIGYGALYAQASAVARALRAEAEPGARVLVLCPPGLDYIVALYGCLLGNLVAVPALPPRFNRPSSRFEALLADSRAQIALVTRALMQGLRRTRNVDPRLAALRWLCVDELGSSGDPVALAGDPSELAMLQYTSGSTAAPRGVMLAHAQLLENCARIEDSAEFTRESELVAWLPPYHDMGLIGCILTPLVVGCHATLMSPFAFITRPARWLEAISRYRGTHSGGPDFAFGLCTRRLTEAQKQDLDLSSWKVAWNGAERVRSETLAGFSQAFASVGFDRHSMRPCYGLAEATLMVSIADARGPRTLRVSERALGSHVARFAEEDEDARILVSSGKVVQGHTLRVVDPDAREPLVDGAVGELWVRGPSIPRGYFERPELNAATFEAELASEPGVRWLRTGDLGFVHEGEVFVTGRRKDLLIVRGRNYYPDDLEFTAQSAHPALRPSSAAAFSLELGGEERVSMVLEVEGRDADYAAIASRVREAVFAEHELVLHEVWLVAPGQVPKTSSGKVQRSLVKQRCAAGELEARHRSVVGAAAARAEIGRFEPEVARACCELLGLSELDRDEDFFTLGAQSVLAMQLAARLERSLGLQVPLRAIFETPTVAGLARALETAPPLAQLPAIAPRARPTAPLSLSQERIWFEHLLDPGSSAYNISGALVFRGPLSRTTLERVANTLIARHAVLRARYQATPEGPVQDIAAHEPTALAMVEVASLQAAEAEASALAREPFDLERGPLLRLKLFRVTPETHVFVLIVHHIAGDGLSIDVLLEELFALYEADRGGREAELPLPEISFLDFASWQRQTLALAPVEQAVAYFRERLQGAPALLALPTDKPRPPRRSFRGALVKRPLSPALLGTLDALGRQHQATRYMTLLTGFCALLARYAGESDLSVGTPVAGRNHAQTESLIGTFVNMLVMRVDVALEESFLALLARVRDRVLEAFEHQNAPFERVVEALAPVRSQAHSPLFQVMFDYQALRKLRPQVERLQVEPILLSRGASQYDLSLSVLDTGQTTSLHLEYRTDLFEHATAERLADHFVALLESVAVDPRVAVSKLRWLSPGERDDLLALGRSAPRRSQPCPLFLEAFEARVAREPAALAALDESGSLTYAELDARANQLAHHLRALGVGPDVPVGVFLERTLDLLVALLAVLKAEGCYVPLDPVYPKARIALVLEDAAPAALISHSSLLDGLPAHNAVQVTLDVERAAIARWSPEAPRRAALRADHLAYVIFTSGSTGRPKGVEVPHGALANFLASMAREPGLAAGQRLLAVTTVSFDIAGLELFLPLSVGASVEIASRALAADGLRLSERLARGDVHCLQATPATYRMLLEAGFQGARELVSLCGGEALPRDLAEALLLRSRALFNMYGPTETTIWSACARVDSGAGPVPLGGPIDNTSLYVLDAEREPVPRGVIGELYIGGDGVARGYHKRPDLTRERFVPDPFAGPGARMYRTGDAARFRADGSLEFIGRVDQQVKLRGFRVELGEIEAQLAGMPGIEACAVKLFELGPGDARLVAYLVLRAGFELEPTALRGALRRVLPEYMVPSSYLELSALPLTPNGKIDRKALPAPARESAQRAFVPPRDAIEASLCELFEQVLGQRPVGITDNFFDLGGHSILAVRLFERVFAQTGQRLPLAALFEAPSVAELAALLREKLEPARDPRSAYLVPLAQKPEAAQLFFVHPHGTGEPEALEPYRPLVRALGRPAVGLSCDEDAYLELREVAARHVAALTRQAAGRAYQLVGLGLGGNVAQEIAVQLEQQGQRVERVVVIESCVPHAAWRPDLDYLRTLAGNVLRAAQTLAHTDKQTWATRLVMLREALRRRSPFAGSIAPALEDLVDRASLPFHYRELREPQWNALRRHTARACDAPIHVVRTRRRGLVPLAYNLGWSALTRGETRTHVIARASEALLREDQIETLADALDSALQPDARNIR